MDHMPLGVVVLDPEGRVVLYNRYEEILAGRRRTSVVGRHFFTEVAPCMNVKELGGAFTRDIGRQPLQIETEFSFPLPFLEQPRDVNVRLVSFESDSTPYGALFIEDVSAKRSVDRMKETLGRLLVHDMKNPLSVMMTNLQLLGDRALGGEEREELSSSALAAGQRLHNMFLNLIDITRLEANTLPLDRGPLPVDELLRELIRERTVLFRALEVGLELDLPEQRSGLVALADRALVRRGVENLLDNASRFARSRVIVRAARQDSTVAIEVADDGPGITSHKAEAIFDEFVTVGLPTERTVSTGSLNRGLGLTFVRLMARSHGGRALVEPRSGGGTVFRLELPAQAAP